MNDAQPGPPGADRPLAMLLMSERAHADLFDEPRRARLERLVRLRPGRPLTDLDDRDAAAHLASVEVIVTGWGTPALGEEVLDAAPHLRAVVHAGGSVKGHVAPAFWDRGVVVTSAAQANAIPVAEYTLANILLEGKRAAAYIDGYRRHRDVGGRWRDAVPSSVNFGGVVGIIGLSRTGRRVAELLRAFDFQVLVADPHIHADAAHAVGARLVDLDALLAASDIVTVHAPELPETRELLDARRLDLLRPGAVVINTARGSLIETAALIERCRRGTLRAVLDVTEPEPLPHDSELFDTPGIVLTPHIAGAMHAETHRLADAALDDLERLVHGFPARHRVDAATLGIIA